MEKLNQKSTPENAAETGWDDLAEVTFTESESERSETATADKPKSEALPTSREQVLSTYQRAETASNHGEAEVVAKTMSELDDYWMSNTIEHPIANARWIADLAGVVIDIKPTALIQIPSTELNIDKERIAQMLEKMNIAMADGWEETGAFFVSKQPEKAKELKAKFEKLWKHNQSKILDQDANESEDESDATSRGWSQAEDEDLGRLLGYPETAITSVSDSYAPKGFIQKLKWRFAPKADPAFARHYGHSAEHYQEEFESYERPIHEFLEQYCPKATAELKREKNAKGKPYKWL